MSETSPDYLVCRPADWDGFAAVMGEKGGCGGCWCRLWRATKGEMDRSSPAENRAWMQAAFARGDVNGIVAYDGDRPVWSVACFLIEKAYRRKGLSTRLLEAACDLAAGLGAEVLEGYPVEPPKTPYPPVYAWTGFAGTFRAAGFEEVARRSPTRPMMRKVLGA